MKFNFDVGKNEQHKMEFIHDLFWGRLEFKVDDINIPVEGLPLFSINPDIVRAFLIGDKEKHEVRVQLIRPSLFAGFRKDWVYKIFIDGKEYKTFYGSKLEKTC